MVVPIYRKQFFTDLFYRGLSYVYVWEWETNNWSTKFTLIMEAVSTSETLVNFYLTTRRNIPEDRHLQS
jgi:hypothetical protein